jgi:hypothetical protein
VGSDAAALLLRFKALTGDEETEVLADRFKGIMIIDGAEGVSLVMFFVASKRGALQ